MTNWHPMWATRYEMAAILRDTTKKRGTPYGISEFARVTPGLIKMLMRDPLWALWVMNPYMDSLLKPQGVTHTHWVNLCVTPLHGPCWGALQSMTNHHAFIHRVRNGEVKQSQRTRYIGDPGAYPRVIG